MSNSSSGGATSPTIDVPVSNSLFLNAYYLTVNFNGILYGVELVLYYLCMRELLRWRDPTQKKRNIFLACFSTVLMLLSTINVAVDAVFGQEMWVVNAGFPGGAGGYFEEYSNIWYQTMGSASSMLLVALSDGLLIYRCYMVWPNRWVIAFPCLLFITSFALAIVELYAAGIPSGSLFAGLAAVLELAWLCTTITMNVIVTSIICGRLIYFRNRMHAHFEGNQGMSSPYSRAATIVVESALPYALSGIAGLVAFALNSGISMLILSIWAMFTCICPFMIILRVAQGSGMTSAGVFKSSSRPVLSVGYEVETYRTEGDTTAIHLRDLASSSKTSEKHFSSKV